jgi:hypothetical protein
LIGALTSALVIGVVLLMLNNAGTVWTNRPENVPRYVVPDVTKITHKEKPGGQYVDDQHEYYVWHATEGQVQNVPQGKYLANDRGQLVYLVDPGINGRVKQRDDGTKVNKFDAPKTQLMALIIDGILRQKLPWELVFIGVLIAITLELAGVPSLPFAVGVYLPIQSSVPIFTGGAVRWLVDKIRRSSQAEGDMSPGVLLSSGYIAGGAIAGVLVALFGFFPAAWLGYLNLSPQLPRGWVESNWPSLTAFSLLIVLLALTGFGWLFRGAQSTTPPAKSTKSR